MPRTAKGASTSSEESNAQMSLPTDDEYHAFEDQDQLQTEEARKHHASWKKTNSKALMNFPRSMMIGKALLSGF